MPLPSLLKQKDPFMSLQNKKMRSSIFCSGLIIPKSYLNIKCSYYQNFEQIFTEQKKKSLPWNWKKKRPTSWGPLLYKIHDQLLDVGCKQMHDTRFNSLMRSWRALGSVICKPKAVCTFYQLRMSPLWLIKSPRQENK